MKSVIIIALIVLAIVLLPMFYLMFDALADIRYCRRKEREIQEDLDKIWGRK